MNSPDFQLFPIEWLLVGFRLRAEELSATIGFCRRYDGVVVLQGSGVLVVEFEGDRETIDELLAHLPRPNVTHLWRSGRLSPGAVPHEGEMSAIPLSVPPNDGAGVHS